MTPDFAALASARFVSLTTFRRSGEGVPTPVWIAQDGDDLLVTTPSESGKVKRLRNSPRVEIVPSSRMGRVDPDAKPVPGAASIADETERETDIFRQKYGVEYRIIMSIERLGKAGRKPRVILRIRPA